MSSYTKTILCLANSRKTSGRCVAGRELRNRGIGEWVRPISARPGHEISLDDRRYKNGQDPEKLDVITISMIEPRPDGFQTENHLIDPTFYWTLKRRASFKEAVAAVDGGDQPLWANHSSSYSRRNDRVAIHAANPRDGSLRLIEVTDLDIRVGVEGAEFGDGKRRVRGQFTHAGSSHLLSITDPAVESQYLARKNGQVRVGRALLCVSLSEPWQDYTYKLIAAVILPSPCENGQ